MKANDNTAVLIFEQLNNLLLKKSKSSNILDHNLEKGLSNEQILRDLFAGFLPSRYGIAKGKIINANGTMSRQCDIIIYDKIRCPNLFIDDNNNQILPVEGVYFVIEVKTTLTKSLLSDAFNNLHSVYLLMSKRDNYSTNDFVSVCPPGLTVVAFNTSTTLENTAKAYKTLNAKYPVSESFNSYTEISPGYAKHTKDKYLLASVVVINKGKIHHMLNGMVDIMPYGKHTLGVFLTGLINTLNQIELPKVDLISYFNWILVERKLGGSMRKKV